MHKISFIQGIIDTNDDNFYYNLNIFKISYARILRIGRSATVTKKCTSKMLQTSASYGE
jgi:hypothetical protein